MLLTKCITNAKITAATKALTLQQHEAHNGGNHHQDQIGDQNMPSSTPNTRRRPNFDQDDSAFQQAMNVTTAFSRSLVKIDPCIPSDGSGRILSSDWRRWSEVFVACSSNMNANDKLGLFKRCAGGILLDTLDLLPGATEMGKNDRVTEIEEVFNILDAYFNSEGTQRAAKLEFDSTTQSKEEGNIAFLERVSKKALSCGYSSIEIDEKIMDVMARHARDNEVKQEARRIDSEGRRYKFLRFRDFILNMERFRLMDNIDNKAQKHRIEVNALSANSGNGQVRSEYVPSSSKRFVGREGPSTRNDRSDQSSSRQSGFPRKECGNCGGTHGDGNCFAKDKRCHGCGRIGHLIRMCRSAQKSQQFKRKNQGNQNNAGNFKKLKHEVVSMVTDENEDQGKQVRQGDNQND